MTCLKALVTAMLVAASSATAAELTRYEYLRERLDKIGGEIESLIPEILREMKDSMPNEVKNGKIDLMEISGTLRKLVSADTVKQLQEKVEEQIGGTRTAGRDLRGKAEQYRQPLDELDARISSMQAEYDGLLSDLYTFDAFGFIEPKGAFGPQARDMRTQIDGLRRKRAELKKQIDAKILADDDVKHYKNLEGLEKGVTRYYQDFYKDKLPGGVKVKALIARLGSLVAERARLEDMLRPADEWVVWYNDIGWVHVGSRNAFEREKFTPHRGEIWGGDSAEPLKPTLALDEKGYHSMEEAIKALGKAVAGSVERRDIPLNHPNFYYRCALGGGQKMLGKEIWEHPAFTEYMPKPKAAEPPK